MQLWWYNDRTKRLSHAGVAFYNEKHGDYSLKIGWVNLSKKRKSQLYARAIKTNGDLIEYRIEEVMRGKNGKVQRHEAGYGFYDPANDAIEFTLNGHSQPLYLADKGYDRS